MLNFYGFDVFGSKCKGTKIFQQLNSSTTQQFNCFFRIFAP